jgi:hypothetical protein
VKPALEYFNLEQVACCCKEKGLVVRTVKFGLKTSELMTVVNKKAIYIQDDHTSTKSIPIHNYIHKLYPNG